MICPLSKAYSNLHLFWVQMPDLKSFAREIIHDLTIFCNTCISNLNIFHTQLSLCNIVVLLLSPSEISNSLTGVAYESS